jgi:hypothetical protein
MINIQTKPDIVATASGAVHPGADERNGCFAKRGVYSVPRELSRTIGIPGDYCKDFILDTIYGMSRKKTPICSVAHQKEE